MGNGSFTVIPEMLRALQPGSQSFTMVGRRDRETISHSEALQEGLSKAGSLLERGIGPGSRVGVPASPRAGFVTACIAVWGAGACLVPLPLRSPTVARSAWDAHIRAIGQKVGMDALLDPTSDLKMNDFIQKVSLSSLKGEDLPAVSCEPDAEALILLSSGTTADPKAVALSHRALLAHLAIEPILDTIRPRSDRLVRWGALHHASGFYWGIVRPLVLGVDSTVLSSRSFLADPIHWLDEMSRGGGTVSGGPTFGYSLAAQALEKASSTRLDLSNWRVAVCGGEAVDATTLERFADLARPFGFDHLAYTTRYALTEAGTVCVRGPGQGLRIEVEQGDRPAAVSVGPPAPGVKIDVRGGSGSSVGEVFVRTPFQMTGYVDEGGIGADPESWLATGDVGFLSDGELFLVGRSKDTIVVRGRNLHADRLEGLARSALGGRACLAFGVQDGPTERLVLLLAGESYEDVDDLRSDQAFLVRHFTQRVGVSPEVVVVPYSSFAVGGSGKVDRQVMKRMYVEGTLESLL